MNLYLAGCAYITTPPPPSVLTNSTISKTCVTEGQMGVRKAIFMRQHADK